MVGWPGFEPGTNALKGRCSTAELPAQIFIKQSANYMSQNGFIKHSHKYFTKKCNVSVIVGTLTPRPPALRITQLCGQRGVLAVFAPNIR